MGWPPWGWSGLVALPQSALSSRALQVPLQCVCGAHLTLTVVVDVVHSADLTTESSCPTKVTPPATQPNFQLLWPSLTGKPDLRASCLPTVCSCFDLMCHARREHKVSCLLAGVQSGRSLLCPPVIWCSVRSRQKPGEEKSGPTSDSFPFPPFLSPPSSSHYPPAPENTGSPSSFTPHPASEQQVSRPCTASSGRTCWVTSSGRGSWGSYRIFFFFNHKRNLGNLSSH